MRNMAYVEHRRGVVIDVSIVQGGKRPHMRAHGMHVLARMRAEAVVGDFHAKAEMLQRVRRRLHPHASRRRGRCRP